MLTKGEIYKVPGKDKIQVETAMQQTVTLEPGTKIEVVLDTGLLVLVRAELRNGVQSLNLDPSVFKKLELQQ